MYLNVREFLERLRNVEKIETISEKFRNLEKFLENPWFALNDFVSIKLIFGGVAPRVPT